VAVLANAYAAAGQTGQAERLLRQVVERLPGHVPTRVQWIDLLVRDGRPDDARAQLAELKRVAPDAEEIRRLEASVEGGKKLAAFVEQMPENSPAERVRKAMVLRAEGKVDEAIALCEAAYKEDPTFLPAIEQLLQMYTGQQRRDEALALAEDAAKHNPDNNAIKQLSQMLVERSPEEFEQWQLGQLQAEPDALQRELKLHQFHAQKAAAAAGAGDDAGRAKHVAEAEARLAAAERLKPDDAAVMSRRFEFLLGQKRFDEAGGALLQRMTAANTDEVGGQLLRYRLAMAKGDLGAAEAAARDVVRQRPQFATGHQFLGRVYQLQGRHRDAIKAYTSVLERQGRNYDALKGLADCHYAEEDPATAKTYVDRARQAFPNDVTFREMAINHELVHGDPAKAVAERERLLKAQPDVADNALALAETYLRVLPRRTTPPS
jgi:tetratricopeptide (TPR) repeat protein